MAIHTRTCHICEANCGLLVETEGRRVVSIRGDADDPISRGHVCPKGNAIADLEADPDRLTAPMKRVGKDWQAMDWPTALAEIGTRFAAIKAAGGGAALYIGNPTAHDFSLGFQTGALKKAMGVRGLYSASTVDQMPHQLAQYWLYGHNALFPIPDIERTRHLVILGGNPLASNGSVWTVPDVKRRIAELQARGGRLTVIDPRRSETAGVADAHHFIRPGSDPALLIGLLLALDEAGLVRPGRLLPMLDGWDALWTALRRFDMPGLARACGWTPDAIRALAAELGNGEPTVVYGRIGVSTAPFGTLAHWLINLVNIATGNLDREGGAMFSLPAIDIAGGSGPGSHGRFHSRVSGHPEVMGEFPAVSLAEEITTPGEGQVQALVVVAGNPVLSVPDGGALDAALAGLKLMVSVDPHITATSRHAHYVLPPCGPLAKDHYPLLLAPIAFRNFAKFSPALWEPAEGQKRDWEIVAELARAIAVAQGITLPPPVAPRAQLDRMLAKGGLSLAEVAAHPHGLDLGPHQPRLPDRLFTPDKRIRCAPEPLMADLTGRFADWLAQQPEPGLTLIGRRHIRSNNSWLGNAPRLAKGPDKCVALLNPADAAAHGIADGALVRIASAAGAVEVPAQLTEAMMAGVVSLPHGFGHGRPGVRLGIAGARPGASHNDLTLRSRIDPLSGTAALVGTPVSIAPVEPEPAFAVAAEERSG
ncbi:molybdopterin dinucleotide binding domain-containing protein [Sandarakinorhabdus rubra]|uniref:molybdopterin dinucleotide binding domain-containing protein n=1 Tax=Sandarakinorhabdus rubra TaxID=2672568 RepID=UPI0013DD735D|nr:molybdopterin dinucleotide binding domain-containing protein [Sandarakinorhabdus rubra]